MPEKTEHPPPPKAINLQETLHCVLYVKLAQTLFEKNDRLI